MDDKEKTVFLHILKNVAQKIHGVEHLQKGIKCDLDRLFALTQKNGTGSETDNTSKD